MHSPSHTEQDRVPNCWQCRHFAISWDPKLPYTCRLMGFKSRITPALEVLRADGTRCRGFTSKVETATATAQQAGSRGRLV